MGTIWQYLLELQMHIPFVRAASLRGIYPAGIIAHLGNETYAKFIMAALFQLQITRNNINVHQRKKLSILWYVYKME